MGYERVEFDKRMAKRALLDYLGVVGLNVDHDNEDKIEEMIDFIVAAAVSRVIEKLEA